MQCCQAVMTWFYNTLSFSPRAPGMLLFCLEQSEHQRRKFLYVYCQINTSEVGSNFCAANSHSRMS